MHAPVALVTLLALVVYFWMGFSVARARRRFGVEVPAMTGHPEFERHVRIHANTLEWMVVFLPCLWLCAVFASDYAAAALGLVWIIGRVLYMRGYRREPKGRAVGFYVQALATLLLFLGALAGVVMALTQGYR